MISLSPKRFVMGAFLVMACGYVAASPGIILAEPTSPGNFSVVDGDAGEVEVMPVEDSKAVSVQPRVSSFCACPSEMPYCRTNSFGSKYCYGESEPGFLSNSDNCEKYDGYEGVCTNSRPTGCPAGCPSTYLGDNFCDDECNSEVCLNDGGDCGPLPSPPSPTPPPSGCTCPSTYPRCDDDAYCYNSENNRDWNPLGGCGSFNPIGGSCSSSAPPSPTPTPSGSNNDDDDDDSATICNCPNSHPNCFGGGKCVEDDYVQCSSDGDIDSPLDLVGDTVKCGYVDFANIVATVTLGAVTPGMVAITCNGVEADQCKQNPNGKIFKANVVNAGMSILVICLIVGGSIVAGSILLYLLRCLLCPKNDADGGSAK